MIISLGIIFFSGLIFSNIFEKIKLPSLIGMIIGGIIIGPFVLNLLDKSVLNISSEIRTIVLIIILTRAGFNLDVSLLKKNGIAAILMTFLPASFEIMAVSLIAPILFGISFFESILIGAVLSAVSPAVVVPRMIKIIKEGYGNNKAIPQIILAGASIDDIYVIVIFSTILSILQGGSISVIKFLNVPISIILGYILGYIFGFVISNIFKKISLKLELKVVIFLSFAFLLYGLEQNLNTKITYSSLISIMSMAISLNKYLPDITQSISKVYDKMWTIGEIFLFVLLGASVNINYIFKIGFLAILLIFVALIFRMIGVYFSILKTDFNIKEKIFMMGAYIPKATVQAAIGGIALSKNLAVGEITLSIAVLSILITAPLGAIFIDKTYTKFLEK